MQTVTFAGSNYNIPNQRGDTPWSGLSDFAIAAAGKSLSTYGGSFTLTNSDINLGATFGLVSSYFKSRTANIASAGQLRLANTDTIKFRNTLNDGDLSVAISSNRLTFQGSRLIIAGAAEIVNADVSASAAIAYSKLNLATSIVNADVAAAAAIALTKLAASTAYYWYAANAAGVLTPLAVTASRAVATDANGLPVAAATTATELGYLSGVTSALQTQLAARALTDLSNVASVSANVPMNSKKFTGLAAGAAAGESVRFEQVKYLQVVQQTGTTATSTSSTSFVDTVISKAITPTSASNRIKVTITTSIRIAAGRAHFGVGRGGSPVVDVGEKDGTAENPLCISYIDSPATTSSTTYTLMVKNESANQVDININNLTWVIILEEVV